MEALNTAPKERRESVVPKASLDLLRKSCNLEMILDDEDLEVPVKYILKIVFLGDPNVGKTSIIHRFVNRSFMESYQATIGVDFNTRFVRIAENASARIHVFDLSGHEKMTFISKAYFRRANGAFIVYDESSPTSFHSIMRWKKHLDANVQFQNGNPIHCVLLGNKCDKITMTEEHMNAIQKFVKDQGFLNFFSTSAKEDIGVNEAFDFLIKEMVKTVKVEVEMNRIIDGRFNIAEQKMEKKRKLDCSCSIL